MMSREVNLCCPCGNKFKDKVIACSMKKSCKSEDLSPCFLRMCWLSFKYIYEDGGLNNAYDTYIQMEKFFKQMKSMIYVPKMYARRFVNVNDDKMFYSVNLNDLSRKYFLNILKKISKMFFRLNIENRISYFMKYTKPNEFDMEELIKKSDWKVPMNDAVARCPRCGRFWDSIEYGVGVCEQCGYRRGI